MLARLRNKGASSGRRRLVAPPTCSLCDFLAQLARKRTMAPFRDCYKGSSKIVFVFLYSAKAPAKENSEF
jgi:hypothetical protein